MEQRGLRPDTAFIKDLEGGKLSGAYLLYGEEPYFMGRAVKKAEALLSAAAKDMNYSVLTGPGAPELINACEQLPFFDRLRVVIVRELGTDAAGALTEYALGLPPTTLLLILKPGKAPARGARSAPRKNAKPAGDGLSALLIGEGRGVEFAPYDEIDAARFASAVAKREEAVMERPEAALLVSMLGTDLNAIEQGVKKAAAYVGGGNRITSQAVRACVTPNTAYKVYELTDQLASGNKQKAMAMTQTLLKNGESALGIANYLEGRCRVMLQASETLASGRTEQEALSVIGGNPAAAKYTLRNAKRMGSQRLCSAVRDLSGVSYRQITGAMSDKDALFLALMKNF